MSVKWHYELILKCDIKDCKNSRRFYTKASNCKILEKVARSKGWDFGLHGITICPDCNKKRKKYINEKMAEIK